MWGLGRLEEAKAAWNGAVERYEELGDGKAASTMHRRIAHLEARPEQGDHNGSAPVEDRTPEAEPVSLLHLSRVPAARSLASWLGDSLVERAHSWRCW